MYKRIDFNGSFWEYFFVSLLLFLASVVTLGLLLPYWVYWSVEYFFDHMEIDGHDIHFMGNFWEYFFISLALLILTVITAGIAAPFYVYWSFKYFFTRLEIPDFN